MNQTRAMFLDAYRELNARKLFWITLILSTLVAAGFGGVWLEPSGLHLFFWSFNSYYYNSVSIHPGTFYKWIYVRLGIHFYLTFVASILALISTAGMIPDFLASGSIDLYLSKPIGRLRLFLTRYICGLLFVVLQIFCFSAACFLVIGIRGGAWEPGLFLAVPLVVLFYSYLYCVCALLGTVTRSTISSILMTILFWFAVFSLHTTEQETLGLKLQAQQELQTTQAIDQQQANNASATGDAMSLELANAQRNAAHYSRLHTGVFILATILPKTSETVSLLERSLMKHADLGPSDKNVDERPDLFGVTIYTKRRVARLLEQRSVGWVVGTSVLFEMVILGVGAWIFVRRDY